MSKRYILNGMNRALKAVVRPSVAAPDTNRAAFQNSPNQAVGTQPQIPDVIDFSQAGPVLDLVAQMHQMDVVKLIPVKQPGFIPRSPWTPIAPNTVGVIDQRLIQTYPANNARASYDFSQMAAPARLQSVPGYVVRQTIITRSSPGYPKQALKAPSTRTGGGNC